jgi:hypothetical protein
MTKKSPSLHYRSVGYVSVLGAVIALATLYTACASSPPPPLGSGECTSDSWCRLYAKRPCADNSATKCVGTQCIYVLKIANTPPNMCISGDVRTCNLGGTSTEGIETCAALGGSGGGCNWGTCGPL